jgi:ATP-dependent Lhr-like helicase
MVDVGSAPLDVDTALCGFQPATRQWFCESFGTPTLPQAMAWPCVQRHESILVFAQTGTGKTLAAFLAVVDRLIRQALAPTASADSAADPSMAPGDGTRIVYISPLKALATDVERNLRVPLAGIARCLALHGAAPRLPTVAVRTGDTDARERARYRRHPADILITTPESLALLLTSQAGRALASTETVIVDEIHALVPTKRGAHLALTLERLEELVAGRGTADAPARRPLQRIGLSATQRPLDEVARFLGGVDRRDGRPRPVTIVDARTDKALALSVVHTLPEPTTMTTTESAAAPPVALSSRPSSMLSLLPSSPLSSVPAEPLSSLLSSALPSPSLVVGAPTGTWLVLPPRITALARQHRTLLVFVNARRLAERLAATVNDLWLAEETAAFRPVDGPLALAHHGSLARPQRLQIEEAVKRGDIRVLVATSSMELGVDLPSVDVVVQVDAPPSVAAALQRVGRAGHQVGATSRGVFLPRFPLDVLATAAIVPAMRAGDVEATRVLDNPLDVLAQHIVGAVAVAPRAPAELYALAKGAAPWAKLSRRAFDDVVLMLCGHSAVALSLEGHDGLRGRLRLDAASGLLVPRAGAHRVAVQNVGTIPDRGLYGVHLLGAQDDEPGPKVGELDEEMVFECRTGEVVRLGSSSWRIERITADRVLVTPAPGVPGKLPFWRGEQQLRPVELGRRIGALTRTLLDAPPAHAREQLKTRHGLDDAAAASLVGFLHRQREQGGGAVPTDRVLVIERSRDELLDWRAVLLSPLGGAVLQPLALAVARQARAALGLELEVTVTNDGALFRFPESDTPPDLGVLLPRAAEVEQAVLDALGDSPLFAARFREAAARALVLPRGSQNRRAALWKQRQRARDLFDAVRARPDFPLTLEAAREVVHDVFDLPGLAALLAAIEDGSARVVTVDVEQPSPLATDIIHAMTRTSLYDDDVPAAERKARALSIDLAALRELLGDGALRELLDVDVIAAVEAILARTAPSTWCRHADDLHDTLIRLGALSFDEIALRVRPDARLASSSTVPTPAHGSSDEPAHRRQLAGLLVDELVGQSRALVVRAAGGPRVIAIEDAGRYALALGVVLPPGVPGQYLQVDGDPLIALVRRDASTHALSTAVEVAARVGIAVDVATRTLDELVRREQLCRGAFRPGGSADDYTTSDTLQGLRRRTLAALRQEAAPVDRATFVTARLRTAGVCPVRPPQETLTVPPVLRPGPVELERLRAAIARVQGLSLPWSIVETLVLPARVPGYRPEHLDALTAAGEVVWVGDGARGEHDGDVRLFLADAVGVLWSPPAPPAPSSPPTGSGPSLEESVVGTLQARGASFLAALLETVSSSSSASAASAPSTRLAGVPSFSAWRAARQQQRPAPSAAREDVEQAVWRLVWQGRVTNDGAGALRARARRTGVAAARRRRATHAPPAGVGLVGRFFLTSALVPGNAYASPTERAVAVAEQLLWACGLLDNELVSLLSRGLAPAADVKAALRAMEDQGTIRRGYFVDGATGLQYGTPDAVEALRAQRSMSPDADEHVFVLSAVDPAQPFGADVPWPAPTSPHGPAILPPQRAAQNVAVVAGGCLVGLVTAFGRKILTFFSDTEPERGRQARALARGLAHLAATRLRDGRSLRLVIEDVDGLDAVGAEFESHPLLDALGPSGFGRTAGGYVWTLPRSPSLASPAPATAPATARPARAPRRAPGAWVGTGPAALAGPVPGPGTGSGALAMSTPDDAVFIDGDDDADSAGDGFDDGFDVV